MKRKRQFKFRYILFYKPYGVLCQFRDTKNRATIASYGPFPKDVYPAGRLDADSEGLVLLTNDGRLKHFLIEPRYSHSRTYLVQVERIPTDEDLEKLRNGVVVEGRRSLPAQVRLLREIPALPPRPVPIRFRKNVPTSWLEITLREGRNRQIRKMTAAVGHPTLRLIRVKLGSLTLDGLKQGESRRLGEDEIKKLWGSL